VGRRTRPEPRRTSGTRRGRDGDGRRAEARARASACRHEIDAPAAAARAYAAGAAAFVSKQDGIGFLVDALFEVGSLTLEFAGLTARDRARSRRETVDLCHRFPSARFATWSSAGADDDVAGRHGASG
jgi:hypothetical protein